MQMILIHIIMVSNISKWWEGYAVTVCVISYMISYNVIIKIVYINKLEEFR